MDFPMMNEINENTNAAKKEILEAMPAAGATSAEVEAAKDAIINAIPKGGGVTAQTKAFTNIVNGSVSSTDVTITGSGRIVFIASTASQPLALTCSVDGVSVSPTLNNDTIPGPLEIYFEKSIVFKASTTNRGYYTVQT